MSTIQYDFKQPARFGLEYQGADGERHQPVMIHSAKFGSIERFFGVLTEHYAGAFPAWLAPVQVLGIPIRSDNVGYLRALAERLQGEGVRAEVDDSDDRMQKKILHAQQQKVPFMFVAGERDVEAGAVSIRYRNGVERRGVPIDDAVVEVARNIASRQIEPDALNPETVIDEEP
jgi:threonyl-tRNA synthetase